ncbi:hypothetical protein T02_9361 [Trichinella nativa]|uniref:Uncharacterized protein n=1 Tax=Trichinella nativa TaxID=6335 RepID=A0A0V1LNQ8_9BILA|nr:hypothetical protein T02_9361 [Trichinella nativa]
MPYFNKLAEGKIPTLPPFTSRQTIRTQNDAAPVIVHIYSKSESSKYGEHELIFHSSFRTVFSKLFHAIAPLRVYVENYHDFLEIYKKVIVKALKKTIKVWSRRDSKLKGDCRVSQRHIRLIKSPAVVVDHNTNLEADITNWAVSDPGNIFCHIDKPYFKNQTREPAMAEWSFGSLKKTVYRLPNNTVAMWSCEFFTGILIKTAFLLYSYFHCSLAYLLLNKIAPLVIPRSDKSMEEANFTKKLFQSFQKSAKCQLQITKGYQKIHRLIKNATSVTDHDTNLKAYITKKAFCITYKNQTRESAVAVCIKKNGLLTRFNEIATQLIFVSYI